MFRTWLLFTIVMLTGIVWIGFSIPIDLVLTIIPLQILKRAKLRNYEKRILKMIFCTTLFGTITLYVFTRNSLESTD